MTQKELAAIVRRPDLSTVSPTASLRNDVGLDSLELVEIVVLLEEESGREAPSELIESADTISDLLAWLAVL